MLCDGIHPVFDVSPLEHLGDALDMRLPNASPLPEVRRHIEAQAAALMAKHHCVFLGGDHSVTLSLLRAAQAQHGGGAAGAGAFRRPLRHLDATTSASLRATAPGPMRRCKKAW